MNIRRRSFRPRRRGHGNGWRRLLLLLAVLAASRGVCALLPQPGAETDWDAALARVTLTGDLRRDVVAVAQSQLGYSESGQDYITSESGRKMGYTCYGDWYGNPYGDWCAMFASFCLDRASVDAMPLESSCRRWIAALDQAGLYRNADGYTPRSGDLVFFDLDGQGSANHVGVVAQVTDAGLTVIEGNSDDRVQAVDYEKGDPRILGYGVLPEPETSGTP